MTSSISLRSPFRTIDDPALIEKKLANEATIAKGLKESPDKSNYFSILPPPRDSYDDCSGEYTIQGRAVGFCSIQGGRPSMEDAHLIVESSLTINTVNHSFSLFGIFDGHSGATASKYIKDHTLTTLVQQITEQCPSELTRDGIWNALKLTPVHLHQNFLEAHPEDSSGTTLLIALIINDLLWIANVGDSRAILDDGTSLTEDASPQTPRHQNGVKKRGAEIRAGRAGGMFLLTRALGDRYANYLNQRPKITCYSLEDLCKPQSNGNKRQLIVACDGLSETVKSKSIAAEAQKNVDLSVRELAKTLTYSALKAGSRDNISVMIIRL